MARYRKVSPRLPVVDLARTVAFWTKELGFQVGLLWPEDAPCFAMLDRDDVHVQFNLVNKDKPEPTGHATLSFDVDDALAIHQSLAGRVKIDWGPEVYWYGRREFAIRGPDGYMIIFCEETDEAATCEEE